MSAEEARDALMALAADLTADITAAGYLLAVTDAEDRRRESAERDARPEEDPGEFGLALVQFDPWGHTMQNPQNRAWTLGARMQALQAAQRRALSSADVLGASADGPASAPEPEPRARPRPQPTRYRTRRLRRAPGWVKPPHGAYGGGNAGGAD